MIRHGLATSNSNNSVVYGQKDKVCELVFLVRTRGTFRDQNRADLLKFSVLQQNRRLQQLHANNVAKYFIKRCTIALDLRPHAIVHQVVHGTSG